MGRRVPVGGLLSRHNGWWRLQPVATVSVMAISAGVLAGCAAGAAESALHQRPSLAACVARWNSAVLGRGRTAIRGVADVEGAALMARSTDGVCALGFPLRAGHTGGGGVYVSLDRGDYTQGESPVDGYGSKHPPEGGEAWIRDHAGRETNIEVDPRTGLLRPTRAPIPTLSIMLLDYGAACKRIAPL
jgi:hypothetical protein